MAKFVLASVGTAQFFDQTSGELIATSKTLTDSGINFSVTADEVRGGLANTLLSQFLHDCSMALTLTDSLFDLNYLALQAGGTIQAGADVLTIEQVTVAESKVAVGSTPQPFGTFGTIGWVSKVGEDSWSKITFTDATKEATVSGFTNGDSVCVKYVKNDASSEEFTVSSAFIPAQVYAVLTLPLFKAGTEAKSYSSSAKVGEIQVEIPNFMFDGNVDLSLTAGGVSTTPLSGKALATFTGSESCESNEGYYAKLKQITYNKDEFADVKAIAVANGNIEMKANEKVTLQVYALYSGTKAPRLLDNSKLTFVSKNQATATVGGADGIVSALTEGTATIEVAITGHDKLTTSAFVEVTA